MMVDETAVEMVAAAAVESEEVTMAVWVDRTIEAMIKSLGL